MEKGHIMFISRGMSYGGSGRCISAFSSGLVEQGFKVSLVILRDYKNEYYINSKINVIRLGLCTNDIKVSKANVILKWFPFIAKIIRKEQPDVVIPFGVDICLLTVLGCYKKCKICLTVRSNPKAEPKTEFWRKIRDYIYAKADYVWVQNFQQRELMPHIVQEKIFVIPNPIKNGLVDEEFEYTDNVCKFVNVGRLSTQKNQIVLIKAMCILCEKYTNISLDIYGEGELKSILEEVIRENKMQEKVFLKGRNNNIVEALKKEDVFILSSLFEGMPNALMEAMAIGMPCISTDCETGPKDLIEHKKNGLLVSCNDEYELSRAMECLILNPSKCEEYGKLAKEKIKNEYKEEQITSKLVSILEKICCKGD